MQPVRRPCAVTAALAALQARLQHLSPIARLLQRALTHRSFSADHNERLEFLGDSVLNLAVVAPAVRAPGGPARRRPVAGARQSGQAGHAAPAGARAGAVAAAAPGRRRGALGRPEAAVDPGRCAGGGDRRRLPRRRLRARREALVHRLFEAVEINPRMEAAAKDPKTELQEWLQGRKMKLPVYRVVGTLGAAHKQTFDVECEVPELGLRRARHRRLAPRRRAGRRGGHADPARRRAARRHDPMNDPHRIRVLRRPKTRAAPTARRRSRASAAAWSPSSASPTSASRRCSTRWSARRSASPRARRRPRATASPACAREGAHAVRLRRHARASRPCTPTR